MGANLESFGKDTGLSDIPQQAEKAVGKGKDMGTDIADVRPLVARHFFRKITQSSDAKDLNTVILPIVNTTKDVAAIRKGLAKRMNCWKGCLKSYFKIPGD